MHVLWQTNKGFKKTPVEIISIIVITIGEYARKILSVGESTKTVSKIALEALIKALKAFDKS